MNLSVRNRIYLTIGTFIAAAAASGYFLIYPGILAIMETAAKMEETRVSIEKKYLSGQYLRRATQDIEKVKESAGELSGIFLFIGEEYLFIPEFENQMSELGFKILNADIAEPEAGGKKISDTLNLSFSVQGDFPSAINALASLRKIEKYVNLDQVALRIMGGGVINLDAKARVYRIDSSKIKDIINGTENEL